MKVKVCRTEDVPPGEMRRFDVEEELVLIANIDGVFHATADTCSHADASLSEGIMEGHEVQCPYHGARFDIRTGEALSFPAVSPVETYTVTVEDGHIYVENPLF